MRIAPFATEPVTERSSIPGSRSDSFQLLGMSERGMLPEFFAVRSRHGTPTAAILFSASGVLLLSWMNFSQVTAHASLFAGPAREAGFHFSG